MPTPTRFHTVQRAELAAPRHREVCSVALSYCPRRQSPPGEDYRFDGWSTAADGSGDTYADGDSYTVPDRIALAPYSAGGQQVFQYGWQDVGVGDTADYVEWQPRRWMAIAHLGTQCCSSRKR